MWDHGIDHVVKGGSDVHLDWNFVCISGNRVTPLESKPVKLILQEINRPNRSILPVKLILPEIDDRRDTDGLDGTPFVPPPCLLLFEPGFSLLFPLQEACNFEKALGHARGVQELEDHGGGKGVEAAGFELRSGLDFWRQFRRSDGYHRRVWTSCRRGHFRGHTRLVGDNGVAVPISVQRTDRWASMDRVVDEPKVDSSLEEIQQHAGKKCESQPVFMSLGMLKNEEVVVDQPNTDSSLGEIRQQGGKKCKIQPVFMSLGMLDTEEVVVDQPNTDSSLGEIRQQEGTKRGRQPELSLGMVGNAEMLVDEPTVDSSLWETQQQQRERQPASSSLGMLENEEVVVDQRNTDSSFREIQQQGGKKCETQPVFMSLRMLGNEEVVVDQPNTDSSLGEIRQQQRERQPASSSLGMLENEVAVDQPNTDSSLGEIQQHHQGGKKRERQPASSSLGMLENDEVVVDQPKEESNLEQVMQQGKKKLTFRYGNYNRYYGYRLGKTLDEDPRLKFFEREWFEEKDCLDVGCNQGFITISIAQKYKCQSMLGVDIDDELIEKAVLNLHKEAAASIGHKGEPLNHRRRKKETLDLRSCNNANRRCRKGNGHQSAGHRSDSDSGVDMLLQRVRFRQEDFIEDFPHGNYWKDGMFDTILCLSVTKWIHLNWGDRGLIRLFAKIHHILRPGGTLILEPQPWKSYEKKFYVSEATRKCFREIQIRPIHFKEILLDKIGFKSVEEISQAVPNSSVGFDRSLYLYVK